MAPHTNTRARAALLLTLSLFVISAATTGCQMLTTWLPFASPTSSATPSITPTDTATPTATATLTPTSTPTPTPEPLRLSVDFSPVQAKQGQAFVVKVQSNRPITVTGTLDENRLAFASDVSGAWAIAGMPVTARVGAHPIQLSVVDSLGVSISTTVSIVAESTDYGSEIIEVPPDRVGLLDPAVSEEDDQRLDRVFAGLTPQKLWQGVFLQPHMGPVTSSFGMGRVYNDGHQSYHSGVDLSGAEGAPVAAANNGRVVLAAELKVHGNTIVLDHGLGVFTAYYHLSQILVSEGQEVVQGAIIGHVGNTGLSTGSHLHWDVRVDGVPVDPLEWTSRAFPE